MQTEVIKEKGLDGSQYENVSMGSIGSFGEGKPDGAKADAKQRNAAKGAQPASQLNTGPRSYLQQSPSKLQSQQPYALKQAPKLPGDANFHSQLPESKNAQKRLEINTGRTFRGPMFGARRAPLTVKQGSKTSKNPKMHTTQFEFDKPSALELEWNGGSALSPAKVERNAGVQKVRRGFGSNFAISQRDGGRGLRTHRPSQQGL